MGNWGKGNLDEADGKSDSLFPERLWNSILVTMYILNWMYTDND